MSLCWGGRHFDSGGSLPILHHEFARSHPSVRSERARAPVRLDLAHAVQARNLLTPPRVVMDMDEDLSSLVAWRTISFSIAYGAASG